MCNPPFYEDADDLYQHAKMKAVEPFSVWTLFSKSLTWEACTGSAGEMCTPGGEVAFISRLMEESLVLRGRIQWYTSLLGKLSSVSTLVQKLKQYNVLRGNGTRLTGRSKIML